MIDPWIRRRVENLKFVDLTTAIRTIEYELLPDRPSKTGVLPFGTYIRGVGRGEFKVTDGSGNPLSFLTARESRDKSCEIAEELIRRCGISNPRSAKILKHTREMLDCDQKGFCQACLSDYAADVKVKEPEGSGEYSERRRKLVGVRRYELGCRSLFLALDQLGLMDRITDDQQNLARFLLDLRESYILFVDVPDNPPDHVRVRFDEELQSWKRPREIFKGYASVNRSRSVGFRRASQEEGRESDVQQDLKRAGKRWRRRSFLKGAFDPIHVGLNHHASTRILSSHIDIEVPPDLLVSRIRCLCSTVGGEDRATKWSDLNPEVQVADETGSRAHLHFANEKGRARPEGLPAFVSILITPASSSLWSRGGFLGLLSGILLLIVGLSLHSGFDGDTASIVTMLVFVPGLLGSIIAIDAQTDIGAGLIDKAQKLVVGISVLNLAAALALAFWTSDDTNAKALLVWDTNTVSVGVVLFSSVMCLVLGAYLLLGLYQFKRQGPGEREEGNGRWSKDRNRLESFPPPRRWLFSGEGDRDVPCGWILEEFRYTESSANHAIGTDTVELSPQGPPEFAYRGRWGWALGSDGALKRQKEIGLLSVNLRRKQLEGSAAPVAVSGQKVS